MPIQLASAVLRSRAEPQHQSESNTPDPRVRVDRTESSPRAVTETVTGPDGMVVHLARVLAAGDGTTLLATFVGADGAASLGMAGTQLDAS